MKSPTTSLSDTSDTSDETSVRMEALRTLLETASPAEAGDGLRELMRLAAAGGEGGRDALDLAVRYSAVSDCSTEELLRSWALAAGDPLGFCEDLTAPAYAARKAVTKLVSLSAPGDGGHALKLAARFIHLDTYASKFLVRMWRTVRDQDGFAEHLLAPAFRQEGRTELELSHGSSLQGLRHLTMLERLGFEAGGELTDLTEIGELTGLSDLSLSGCRAVQDLTPIGRLSRLARLDLRQCGAVEDVDPLLSLTRLRELTLTWTKVRSVDGFGRAFAELESLDLRFCRSLTDLTGLAGLPSLTQLQMSCPDQLRDLSPFAAFPSLESLGLHDCAGLTTLGGLGSHPRLAKLGIHGAAELRTTEGIGEQPALRELMLTGCPELADLEGLDHRLPALSTLFINGTALQDLGALAGSPVRTLRLLYVKGLESLSSLQGCADLRELDLRSCPALEDMPVVQVTSLFLTGAHWTDASVLADMRGLRKLELSGSDLDDISALTALPHLAELDLRCCRSLTDIGPLLEMPSLTQVDLSATSCSATSDSPDPVVTGLRARGVSVAIHR